jgi:hypothetical protein
MARKTRRNRVPARGVADKGARFRATNIIGGTRFLATSFIGGARFRATSFIGAGNLFPTPRARPALFSEDRS